MFGMLWFGVVTLLLLDLQRSSVLSLSCKYCYSTISWEDCTSKETNSSCQNQNDASCLKLHRKITLPSGKEVQEFVKNCYFTSLCTRDGCYDTQEGKVTWCDVSCCSTNLCNKELSNSNKRKPVQNIVPIPVQSRNNSVNSSNSSRKQSNSNKRKPVQIIEPRPVHSRNNGRPNLGSSFYVTVAMVTTSLLVARY